MMLEDKIKATVRNVPDFPKPGILFKDITTLFENPELCNHILDEIVHIAKPLNLDAVIGIESRGFLFAPMVAMRLGVPFIMARKKGKLPYKTISQSYLLEYGEATIEINQDVIQPNWNILIHDDLLATGGTAEAVAKIVQRENANVAGFCFIISLSFLQGEKKLANYSKHIVNLATY
ncbi:MAG: adenine phosphoribosyltransferase, partial [Bacteroidia bacterium]